MINSQVLVESRMPHIPIPVNNLPPEIANAQYRIPSSHTVIVRKDSDLPQKLKPNTLYILDKEEVKVSKPIAWADGASIVSFNRLGVTLSYQGYSSLFYGVNCNVCIKDFQIKAPNAILFDFSNTASDKKIFVEGLQNSTCKAVGELVGFEVKVIDLVQLYCSEYGLVLAGTDGLVTSITRTALTSDSDKFVGIDQGISTNTLINYETLIIKAPRGAVGICGLSNSGNVSVGGVATVRDCQFIGGMEQALQGISESDSAYTFKGNRGAGIKDSCVFARVMFDHYKPQIVNPGVLPADIQLEAVDLSRWSVECDDGNWYLKYIGYDTKRVIVRGFLTATLVANSPSDFDDLDTIEATVYESDYLDKNTKPKKGCVGKSGTPVLIQDVIEVYRGKKISLEVFVGGKRGYRYRKQIQIERLDVLVTDI